MATHGRARRHGRDAKHVSGWAEGGAVFAAVVMVTIGAFQVISGLAAIFDGGFFKVSPHYEFNYSTTGWGWVQLVLGGLILARDAHCSRERHGQPSWRSASPG